MQAIQARQWDLAEQLAGRALAMNPQSYEARQVRALAPFYAGRPVDAMPHAEALVSRFPTDPFAHSTFGLVLNALGRTEQAIKAFRRTVSMAPQHGISWLNLGQLYLASGRPGDALPCLENAIAHGAATPEALKLAAECALEDGDLATSVRHLRRLEAAAPPAARWRLLGSITWPPMVDSREQIAARVAEVHAGLDDFIARPQPIADPLHDVGATGFYMAYQGFDDTALQEKIARAHRLACPALEWRAPHVEAPRRAGRIRIGIVSRHLNNHTIGKLNIGLAQKLDRERFEVVVMRPPGARDFLAGAFEDCAQRVVTLPMDIFAAQRAIADAAPDVIFYPDIGMDPFTYFLPFARLARVQFTTWGHPVTTGIPNMDYFLSTRHAEPQDARRFYSERLVALEHPPSFYYRPRPPEPLDLRAHLGLGASDRIYASMQTLYKMHPDFDDALVSILRADPAARVVLIAARREGWNAKLRSRIARAGPDVADRVILMPPVSLPEYLGALRSADALLDTFHFGGGCSSYESFGMSAPVVTLPGERMRSRITAGLYRHMGQSRWIARDAADFVRLAQEMAHGDAAGRRHWIEEIAEGASRFLEDEGVVREYEDFVEAALEGKLARDA